MDKAENRDSARGFGFALAAYMLWGFLPIYMKALSDVPVLEVLAHRVIWSVPVAGAILIWLGRTADLRAALRNPRMIGMAGLTAALISVNWAIYVWSIQSGQALEAALGYYINPLFSVFLGAVLLKERLSRAQWAAIALAALAVLVLTYEAGRVPVVALGLTGALGQIFIFVTIAKFGALTCSIIGLARKVTTLVASIYFYGHSLNAVQFTGLSISILSMIMNFMGKKKGGGHGHGGPPPSHQSDEELQKMLGDDEEEDCGDVEVANSNGKSSRY